jgi:hypothetical protein
MRKKTLPIYEIQIEETSELKVNFMENPAHGVNAISFQKELTLSELREREQEISEIDLKEINNRLDEQLILSELRAKYPHIKSNSVKGFLKKLEDGK